MDTDPLAMSGKIGYFGVGAQHSVTWGKLLQALAGS